MHVDVVDISDVAFQDEFHRVLDLLGVLGRADEVVACAAGDYAEGDVVKVHDAVQHLVEGAVSAHDDELGVGLCGEFAREHGGVTRVLGVVHFIFFAVLFEEFFHGFECLQALPLAALRIDDYVEH